LNAGVFFLLIGLTTPYVHIQDAYIMDARIFGPPVLHPACSSTFLFLYVRRTSVTLACMDITHSMHSSCKSVKKSR